MLSEGESYVMSVVADRYLIPTHAGSLESYIQQVGRVPLLSAEECDPYQTGRQGGAQTDQLEKRNQLVKALGPVVATVDGGDAVQKRKFLFQLGQMSCIRMAQVNDERASYGIVFQLI